MKRLLATLLLLAGHGAWAIDIDAAKAQGLVGEAADGYLAAVRRPVGAEVQALIEEVNVARREHFERTAARTGATLEQVRVRFYQLAVQRSEPGNYYQTADGTWRRKE